MANSAVAMPFLENSGKQKRDKRETRERQVRDQRDKRGTRERPERDGAMADGLTQTNKIDQDQEPVPRNVRKQNLKRRPDLESESLITKPSKTGNLNPKRLQSMHNKMCHTCK